MIKKTILLIIFIGLLSACQPQKDPDSVCDNEMILVGGGCCLDNNSNSICDEFELPQAVDMPEVEQEQTQSLEEKEFINKTELQESIKYTFYDENRIFWNIERKDLVGIEKKFNISEMAREFYVLNMIEEKDYLHSYEEFSNFIHRLYDLDVKNYDLDAVQFIDWASLYDFNWQQVYHEYDYSLDEFEIDGHKLFHERHVVYYIVPFNNIKEVTYVDRVVLWCTPELIIWIRTTY